MNGPSPTGGRGAGENAPAALRSGSALARTPEREAANSPVESERWVCLDSPEQGGSEGGADSSEHTCGFYCQDGCIMHVNSESTSSDPVPLQMCKTHSVSGSAAVAPVSACSNAATRGGESDGRLAIREARGAVRVDEPSSGQGCGKVGFWVRKGLPKNLRARLARYRVSSSRRKWWLIDSGANAILVPPGDPAISR